MSQKSKAMELVAALNEMVKSRQGNLQICEEAATELHRLSLLVAASQSIESLHALVDEAVALKAQVEYFEAKAELPNWPRNATEVRDFIGSQFQRTRYAREDHAPDEEDSYTLTAHDFLSAVLWWADVLPKPEVQKFTVLLVSKRSNPSLAETGYLAHVRAVSVEEAKQLAKAQACIRDNPDPCSVVANPDEYRVLLVINGHHEALF